MFVVRLDGSQIVYAATDYTHAEYYANRYNKYVSQGRACGLASVKYEN